jgi:hypothetical protein
MGRSRPCSLLFRKMRFIVSIDSRFRPPRRNGTAFRRSTIQWPGVSSADIAETYVAGLSE